MKTVRQYLTVLLIVLPIIAPSAGSLMAQDANIAEVNKIVVRRWLSDVMVHGNRTAIDELVALDFVGHEPLGSGNIYGREGMYGFIASQHAMLTNIYVTEVALVAEDDMASCLMIIRGTFTESWGGLLPNGADIQYMGNTFFRLSDGLIVEAWFVFDTLSLMQQLSAPPSDPTLFP